MSPRANPALLGIEEVHDAELESATSALSRRNDLLLRRDTAHFEPEGRTEDARTGVSSRLDPDPPRLSGDVA
jgi:hypothetical protein